MKMQISFKYAEHSEAPFCYTFLTILAGFRVPFVWFQLQKKWWEKNPGRKSTI